MNKADIEKLNGSLKKGDRKQIASESNISVVTVNRFFSNKHSLVSDETAASIVKSAAKIIRERNRLNAKSEQLINSI